MAHYFPYLSCPFSCLSSPTISSITFLPSLPFPSHSLKGWIGYHHAASFVAARWCLDVLVIILCISKTEVSSILQCITNVMGIFSHDKGTWAPICIGKDGTGLPSLQKLRGSALDCSQTNGWANWWCLCLFTGYQYHVYRRSWCTDRKAFGLPFGVQMLKLTVSAEALPRTLRGEEGMGAKPPVPHYTSGWF